MTSTAKVTWVGPGLRLVGEGGHGPAIVVDHVLPDEERQEGGPRPMELLLIGLAGCTSMDVVSILQKKRQPLIGLQTKVTAERAEEHPRVYTGIHVEFVVTGKGVKPEAVERAIELSETKYCSATAMLRHAVEITTSYRIIEDE
jgi:putative redox protein